mmetsp:Transcript_35527/g.118810  ORF Transcript_35527/g.118810 Transcript_35527/m.118810 type:complete len:207 (+) Transcript_35527:220-840(+)
MRSRGCLGRAGPRPSIACGELVQRRGPRRSKARLRPSRISALGDGPQAGLERAACGRIARSAPLGAQARCGGCFTARVLARAPARACALRAAARPPSSPASDPRRGRRRRGPRCGLRVRRREWRRRAGVRRAAGRVHGRRGAKARIARARRWPRASAACGGGHAARGCPRRRWPSAAGVVASLFPRGRGDVRGGRGRDRHHARGQR